MSLLLPFECTHPKSFWVIIAMVELYELQWATISAGDRPLPRGSTMRGCQAQLEYFTLKGLHNLPEGENAIRLNTQWILTKIHFLLNDHVAMTTLKASFAMESTSPPSRSRPAQSGATKNYPRNLRRHAKAHRKAVPQACTGTHIHI